MNIYRKQGSTCIIEIDSKVTSVPLRYRNESGNIEFKIDVEDYKRVCSFNWIVLCSREIPYAHSYFLNDKGEPIGHIALHHLITSFEHKTIDHINRDTTDNRKSNLRSATNSQNQMNSKTDRPSIVEYKGVTIRKNSKKPFRARITLNGKVISLGDYYSGEQAALAYNIAASKMFGEFARLNILKPVP